jgi:hypothetical protein
MPFLSSFEHTARVARESLPDLDRRQREPPGSVKRSGEIAIEPTLIPRAALSLLCGDAPIVTT